VAASPGATNTGRPSFVPADERERIVAVFADLVAERGMDGLRLEDLAEPSGLDIETVKGYFPTEDECLLAAGEIATDYMFRTAGEAFLSTAGDCPLAARAALGAMLEAMASIPSFMHLAVVEYRRAGERAGAVRRRCMDQFAEFLIPGFAAGSALPPQPEVLSLLIAGGIYEILCTYYLDGRLENLPEALPAITFFTVAPFFGVEEARRVSSLPAPSGA
jgi:AcrR family transcriptional regulator